MIKMKMTAFQHSHQRVVIRMIHRARVIRRKQKERRESNK